MRSRTVNPHKAERQSVPSRNGGQRPAPRSWCLLPTRHQTPALKSSYVTFFQLPWVAEAMLERFGHAGLRFIMCRSGKRHTFEPRCLVPMIAGAGLR